MADSNTGEKTEEPTPERLRKLREEGNVPKSQDISTAIGFMAAFGVLAGIFPFISSLMFEHFRSAVRIAKTLESNSEGFVAAVLYDGLITMVLVTAPVLLAAAVLSIATNVAQIGFLFTLKPITPKFDKLNPVQGLKNLFNKKKLVELLKTTIKFVVIAYLCYVILKESMRDITFMVRGEMEAGLKLMGSLLWDFCIKIGGVFVAISAFDFFYQRKQFTKDNMMSKHDIKQEYKQSEGDPQHKAERKRFHQEILNSASPAAVKNADVVVRNPDHIAVALKYDKEKEGGAPSLVAKGERLWAEKIIEAAKHYGIPIVRNVPLAQALNKLDVGEEIPEELYEAVAEVLTFVFNLSEEQKKKTLHPERKLSGEQKTKPNKPKTV